MVFAAFDASSAKGALAGIVAPGEFALASLELNGAGSTTHFADRAAGASRWIELHESAKAPGHFGAKRETHGA
jgi:hypothetical protein